MLKVLIGNILKQQPEHMAIMNQQEAFIIFKQASFQHGNKCFKCMRPYECVRMQSRLVKLHVQLKINEGYESAINGATIQVHWTYSVSFLSILWISKSSLWHPPIWSAWIALRKSNDQARASKLTIKFWYWFFVKVLRPGTRISFHQGQPFCSNINPQGREILSQLIHTLEVQTHNPNFWYNPRHFSTCSPITYNKTSNHGRFSAFWALLMILVEIHF